MFFNEVYLRNNVNSNCILLLYNKKDHISTKLTKPNIQYRMEILEQTARILF